ncbi:MAG: DNA primase [Phenylobacterium sp. RIFCSPHIGHO2_01_FULL_70_10]|nr:MAG: DNA primase [Phenylobacterium sp. RIFCSPHIGHO2_01_FULL_70_10]
MSKDLIQGGEVRALTARKITEETCRKFNYRVATLSDGRTVQIAPYYDENGQLIAQKVRPKNKDEMFSIGPVTSRLFGQHLWSQGGKKIVVTEGEIDALTVSQVQGNKWPVVSVPNGANGAAKALKRHLEWLSSFEEVILMFDMDEQGRAAAEECAQLFEPGKAKIATLPHKDPNECLQKGDAEAIINGIWRAAPYRPDGIITLADVREEAIRPAEMGKPWFLPRLTELTYGRREGELYGFGAGTGAGKSDFFTQQAAFDVVELQEPVGLFFLEQPCPETAQRLAGKVHGKPFHIPGEAWTVEELTQAIDQLDATGRVFLYQHFGQSDWDRIKTRIRFLRVSQGVRHIYLDHLTALADPSNEKESLETLMAELAGLAQELGLIVHYISHLTTPDGTPHEEGGRVTLRQFKGSRAIGFWTYFAFGLERNQTHEDPEQRTITTLRCLKDRYTGRANGEVILLKYDQATTRLAEYSPAQEEVRRSFMDEPDDDDDIPF